MLKLLRCAAVLLLAGGCSSIRATLVLAKPSPHVAVKGYPIDLEYGKEPIAVAAVPVASPDAPSFLQGGDLVLSGVDVSFLAGGPITPIGTASSCPEPGPDVAAERPITTDVKVRPEVGVYRFKQAGTLKLGTIFNGKIDGLTSRKLSNVVDNALGGFDYEMDLRQSVVTQIQKLRVIPASSTSIGQPAAGIELISLQLQTPSGNIDFNPLAPVTIFPLPASENTAVTGAGVDAQGTTMTVQGTITHKDRIEGCGEVVDGWTADTTWTFVRGGGTPVVWTYSYTVATQHGGLIVGDHLQTTDTVGPVPITLDITSAIGGVHPKPEAR